MLSHDLVDWAMSVPTGMKIRNGVGKYIVREAIRPWLPEGIVDRRKQGFQIPLAEWFAGDLGRFAHELWSGSGVSVLGILNPAGVERTFAEHRSGRRDHGRFLFALAMFSLWWSEGSKGQLLPLP